MPNFDPLPAIARMLRTDPEVRERWNFAHIWDSCSSTGCALGWAKERGLFTLIRGQDYAVSLAAASGRPVADINQLFVSPYTYCPELADLNHVTQGDVRATITPDRVAAAIEHYLSNGGSFAPGYVSP